MTHHIDSHARAIARNVLGVLEARFDEVAICQEGGVEADAGDSGHLLGFCVEQADILAPRSSLQRRAGERGARLAQDTPSCSNAATYNEDLGAVRVTRDAEGNVKSRRKRCSIRAPGYGVGSGILEPGNAIGLTDDLRARHGNEECSREKEQSCRHCKRKRSQEREAQIARDGQR
jgi:hypothetical protein